MPELHQTTPFVPLPPAAVIEAAAGWLDDPDYALGCECANPVLQIEHWDQESTH